MRLMKKDMGGAARSPHSSSIRRGERSGEAARPTAAIIG
jgi:hypothetical protein